MSINRNIWADAYKFHAAALDRLGQMEPSAFWTWFHATAAEIAQRHGNSTLIVNLTVAVFEDVEAQEAAATARSA